MENNSLYGQARQEGGIVDMFLDDIKSKKKKGKVPKGLEKKRRSNYCANCGTMIPK